LNHEIITPNDDDVEDLDALWSDEEWMCYDDDNDDDDDQKKQKKNKKNIFFSKQ
jgi:hypothetical protein